MRRLIPATLATLTGVVALATPVSAGGGASGGADPDGSGGFANVIRSGGATGPGGDGSGGSTGSGGATGGSGGGGSSGCPGGYRVSSFPVNDLTTGASFTSCDVFCGVTFLANLWPCPTGGGGASGGAATPKITGADLAQQAVARFRLATPALAMWPEPDRLIVRWPVQLWLAGGWEPQSATASAAGLSATVTAKPQRVTWTMGDGGSVSCSTAGRPATQSGTSGCSYTYQGSSAGKPGDAYRVSATVTFAASWTATDGTSGDLGPLTSPAGSVSVQVGEVQAVNTPAPGGRG